MTEYNSERLNVRLNFGIWNNSKAYF